VQIYGNDVLQLKIKEAKKETYILTDKILNDFSGDIIFKVISKNGRYQYLYSIDNGVSFFSFAETKSDLILCRGYTGAYLGIYASSNGQAKTEYADFDWVDYKGFSR